MGPVDPVTGTLADVVRANARAYPDETAFICGDRRCTFAAFDRATNRVANGLVARGVTDGARFAYLCRNSERVFELFYGGLKAGAVPVGVNWRLAPPEAAYILQDCEARLLFTDAESAPLALAAAALSPGVEQIIVIEGASVEGAIDYPGWRDSHSDLDPTRDGRVEDVACQLYTSGTTGHPKGVLLTHRSFLAQRRAGADTGPWMNAGPADVALVVMPVYHIGGLSMGTIAFHQGSATVVSAYTDPGRLIETIERHAVTYTFLVPAVLQTVVDHPDCTAERLRSLRIVRYGAAPITAALLRRVRAMLSCELAQMYGMTEACGTVACLPPADHNDREVDGRMRSCGKPLAHIEIAVLDPEGRRLPPGAAGEICVRAASLMSGYWKLPEATAQAYDGDWYRSGDAGYVDQDGYLFLHDRIKDMIISGGENIYPAEVESAICDHPGVLEAAVIGVPDARWGEAVKAIVVAREGEQLNEADLIAFLRGRIAGFKVPKSIDLAEALPRNPSGKILRRELREPYWRGEERLIS
jgi:fatty-acyl-CoA synthase